MSTPAAVRPYVTIVSGLPRSGTSVMMQMLHAGRLEAVTDGVRTADEDNPRGYFEFEAAKAVKADAAWLPGAVGKVVKMVHLLLLDLPVDGSSPPYRVVFMRRSLDEVIASQAKMLARQGKSGGAIPPAALKAVYAQQIELVQAHMRRHAGRFAFVDVGYADVVSRPRETAATLARFLDGGPALDETAMASAVDGSLYRNRA